MLLAALKPIACHELAAAAAPATTVSVFVVAPAASVIVLPPTRDTAAGGLAVSVTVAVGAGLNSSETVVLASAEMLSWLTDSVMTPAPAPQNTSWLASQYTPCTLTVSAVVGWMLLKP